MFNEPNEDPAENSSDPANRAREKSDEFRMHAELAAVFEAPRKFDAQILPNLDAQLAREIQRGFGKLEKAKMTDTPVISADSETAAAEMLNLFAGKNLSAGDYHINRRPGEVVIVRWLSGADVETFYERFQAHFDAALTGYREDEHQAQDWKQDAESIAYLKALDAIELKVADRYLREIIRQHNIFVLSTQTADEINISYLAETIMGVTPAEIVGARSAPPEEPSESDLAWFFKLFSLRGMKDGVEQMCFFTYLQKSTDSFDEDES